MITKDNFKNLLVVINFKQNGNIFTKQFDELNAILKVDFDNQELVYPEDKGLKVENKQTCNFSDNENFVVFECVHRLFEKGYKPEHIVIEPKWKVGHGASGGRADILIKDNSGKSLLIIECKTEGREFNSAWKDMQNHATQLLSYAQQQRSTKFLCLYTSDFEGGKVVYENRILTLEDNEKLIEEKKALKPLTYKDAVEVEDLYKVWKETYALDYATKGIFESDIQPYHIGKLNYSVDDLDIVNSEKEIQSKYHEFATILRQHNVSGRENAFDKLVNLFLCKIVDESLHSTDLKFYWKGIAYDSPFDLQDRLQRLYKDGMNEFLGEDVTYIDQKTIENAFKFVKEKPDATKAKILEYFRELKFFTNNDFAFIDVHNENLFHQNFEVLLKIVKMLQDLRLQSENQNQFLGDMFEGFLDQGVKQSEGQFFTPSPITKFIMLSLPLEEMIKSSEKPPRAIDYACGAGHFLNELAMQIKPFVEKHSKGDIKDFYNQIYGIEKEYRLSKVAKVSAFMYGQDQIHIIYGDALAKLDKNKHKAAADIKNNSFDILTANPPYSVKGFLETLSETERAEYSMIETIDEKSYSSNNSIETFFIERAKQLLKPNGVAGIIAPSSILNKGNQKYPVNKKNNYVATREILLKYFDIVAIVELGSQTFGKTGTNTVILFLRRKDDNPAPADHYQNRVNDWFAGDGNQAVFDDAHFIKNYCDHIEINFDNYKTLLSGKPSEELLNYEIFQDYRKEFDKLSEIKNLETKKFFKDMKADERKEYLDKRFLDYVREIEKDKLYYFTLAAANDQKTVIVKSPSGNKEQKEFLGYEWSSAKGNEGIKYFASEYIAPEPVKTEDGEADAETERLVENLNNLSRIETALYDPNDSRNPDKLNTYINRNFNREDFTVPESLAPVLSTARTVEMLDFTRTEFNIELSLTPRTIIKIETKWDLEKIDEVVKTIESGSRPQGGVGNINSGAWSLGGEHIHPNNGRVDLSTPKYVPYDFFDKASKGILKENDILICKDGALTGKVALLRNELNGEKAMVNEHVFILRSDNPIRQKYVFNFLFSEIGQKLLKFNITGAAQGGLNSTNLKNIKIPLPPKDIQEKLVAECEAVDSEVSKANEIIEKNQNLIATRLSNLNFAEENLGDIAEFKNGLNYSRNSKGEKIKIIGVKDFQENFSPDLSLLEEIQVDGDLPKNYELKPKDILVVRSNGSANLVGRFLFVDELTDKTSYSGFTIRIRPLNDDLDPKFLCHFLRTDYVRNKLTTGSGGMNIKSLNQTQLSSIKVPIPPPDKQEKLIEEIKILEEKITAAQKTIDGAAERKQAIMKKYL